VRRPTASPGSPETEAEADSYTIAGINAGLPQPEAAQRSRKKPTP